MTPGDILSQDPMVQLMLAVIWALALLTLYGAACLIEWVGRTRLGINWEAVWNRFFPFMGE